jgi:hypothetical protein
MRPCVWLENGTHIRQVADLLGHSSISITGDVYGHGSDDGARRAVEGLIGTLRLRVPVDLAELAVGFLDLCSLLGGMCVLRE